MYLSIFLFMLLLMPILIFMHIQNSAAKKL